MRSLSNRLEKLESKISIGKNKTTHFDQLPNQTLKEALNQFNDKNKSNFTEKEINASWSSLDAGELGIIWHHPDFTYDAWLEEQLEKECCNG